MTLQIKGEWYELDTDSIINQLNPGLAEQVRRFARNQFTNEVIYQDFRQLRREYIKLCEALVISIGAQHASQILEEAIKPSYRNQKRAFESEEA